MPTAVEQVETTVVETLVEIGAEPQLVTRDATWDDLDIDSLDLVELIQVVEERFGLEIKSDELADLTTVGQAIDFIHKRLP